MLINDSYSMVSTPRFDFTKTLMIDATILSLAISSPAIRESEYLKKNSINYSNYEKINTFDSSSIQYNSDKLDSPMSRLNNYADYVFGKMRNASEYENEFIYQCMEKTAIKTGVNIFDI